MRDKLPGDLGSVEAIKKRRAEIEHNVEMRLYVTMEAAMAMTDELGRLDEEEQHLTNSGFYKE